MLPYLTPSSRFLSFPQVSNHSSHSPSPQKSHLLSPALRIRSNAFETSNVLDLVKKKVWCFFGKNHIKSVIFSIKFAENYSSLPLLFLMYVFLFTMIIRWPHPRFCLGYMLVLLDADTFQNSSRFTLQHVNEHPVFLAALFSFQFRGPKRTTRLQSFLHGWLIILGGC